MVLNNVILSTPIVCIVLVIINIWYILSVFFKCSLFHNSNVFGSCIIHILYTGCAKIKKKNSGAKRLNQNQTKRVGKEGGGGEGTENYEQTEPDVDEHLVPTSRIRLGLAPDTSLCFY